MLEEPPLDRLPTRPALYFYDQGGDLIDPALAVDVTGDLVVAEDGSLTVLTEMEPLGQLTIATHGRGDLVSGSVRCSAPARSRINAIAVETDASQRTFTTLPVTPVDYAGGIYGETVLDFAHFANGTWITDLVFLNLSIEPSGPPISPFHTAILPSRPAIYFYDTEGNPIAPASVVDITGELEVTEDGALTLRTEMEPLGVVTISTHGRGDLVTGSVRVVSDGPIGGGAQ